MVTRLWGGNETAVLAMIRALAIADLAVSVNRKQMERNGEKVIRFAPGVTPSSFKN